ncbi:MAG TPA: hypothetical protein VJ417_08880, partial [Candidatus Glassbacteria bacterium]|nr:hypothetical protein [Candidatus Glassbacteria bacterium]
MDERSFYYSAFNKSSRWQAVILVISNRNGTGYIGNSCSGEPRVRPVSAYQPTLTRTDMSLT